MKIKSSLVLPFMRFAQKDGFYLTEHKDDIVMKKKDAFARFKMTGEEYTDGNDLAMRLYKRFLTSWLNGGKAEIDKLNREARIKIQLRKNQSYLEILACR